MDSSHAEKALEAGEIPPPAPSTIAETPPIPEKKPPLSKKSFMALVLLILIGIIAGIGYVMKNKRQAEEKRQAEMMTTTTVATTTTPALRDLSDEEIMKQCGHKYKATLGKSSISVFSNWNGMPEGAQKSAFWLEGDWDQDKLSIKKAKVLACLEEIPTIVINMRPSGLRLMHEQNDLVYFDKEPIHQSWEEYDNSLKRIVAELKQIPAIVIVEPKLLQLTFDVTNLQYDYENGIYRDAFIERAQKITNVLQKSWVYVDAGDSHYLHEEEHLEFMATSLLRIKNIRGFAMNSLFFANLTFVEQQARKMACRTNLFYITDTSRNGGEFSHQEIEKIAECRYDPPNVKSSNKPMWGIAASQAAKKTRRRRGVPRTYSFGEDFGVVEQPKAVGWSTYVPPRLPGARGADGPRLRSAVGARSSIPNSGPNGGQIRSRAFIKSANAGGSAGGSTGSNTGGGNAGGSSNSGGKGNNNTPLSEEAAEGKLKAIEQQNRRRKCFSRNSKMTRSDGFIWLRPNGESDGRLARRGEFQLCLKKHTVTCGDSCPLLSGQPCGCDGKGPGVTGYGPNPGYGQPSGYPGGYPMAPPSGYYPPPGAYQPYQAVQPASYQFHG